MALDLQAIVARRMPRLYRCLRFARRFPRLVPSYIDDTKRFSLQSSAIFDNDKGKLRAVITAKYHNVEKGLSLPSPRPGFGTQNITTLISLIDRYVAEYGVDEFLEVPVGVIGAYLDFNRRVGCSVSEVESSFDRLRGVVQGVSNGVGVKTVKRDSVMSAVEGGGIDFLLSRSSVRQFSREPIPKSAIEAAVRAAQKSPVVCNRQSGRVRAYIEREDIRRILEIQGGARGFADEVSALFCISVDLRSFNGVGERYQGWIDGGLFAMNFILGLHSQGVGSCCLNWSKDVQQDRIMRDFIKIPENESIIMFVAAGLLRDEFSVACSPRLPTEDVLKYCFLR